MVTTTGTNLKERASQALQALRDAEAARERERVEKYNADATSRLHADLRDLFGVEGAFLTTTHTESDGSIRWLATSVDGVVFQFSAQSGVLFAGIACVRCGGGVAGTFIGVERHYDAAAPLLQLAEMLERHGDHNVCDTCKAVAS